MKKTITFVISIIMTFSLVACGSSSSSISGTYHVVESNDEQYYRFNKDGTYEVATVKGSMYTISETGAYSIGENSIIIDNVAYEYDSKNQEIRYVSPFTNTVTMSMQKCKDEDFPDKRSDLYDIVGAVVGTYKKDEGSYSYYVQLSTDGSAKWASRSADSSAFKVNEATYSIDAEDKIGGFIDIDLIWGAGQLEALCYDTESGQLCDINMNRTASEGGMYAYWTKVDDNDFAKVDEIAMVDEQEPESLTGDASEYIGTPGGDTVEDIEEWFRSTDIDFYCESEYVCKGKDNIGDFFFFGLDGENKDWGYYLYPIVGKIVYVDGASSITRVELEDFRLTNPRNLE